MSLPRHVIAIAQVFLQSVLRCLVLQAEGDAGVKGPASFGSPYGCSVCCAQNRMQSQHQLFTAEVAVAVFVHPGLDGVLDYGLLLLCECCVVERCDCNQKDQLSTKSLWESECCVLWRCDCSQKDRLCTNSLSESECCVVWRCDCNQKNQLSTKSLSESECCVVWRCDCNQKDQLSTKSLSESERVVL